MSAADHWPPGVTLTREPDSNPLDVTPLPREGFTPSPPPRRHLVAVGSSACSIVQDFPADDGAPFDDPHYGPSPRTDAQEQARLARESILRPSGLASLGQPAGDGLSRPATFNDLRGSK